MGKIAFLFAGQGAQYPGMGQELCLCSPKAADVFKLAEEYRPGLQDICFSGSKEDLAQTVNTQPCVFTVDLAAAMALTEKGIQPDGVAGFSLGEMAALAFAGAMSYEQAFQLVCKRAELMQQAAEASAGGMAAILRLPDEKVEEICKGFSFAWPVNYNCDGQLVVAAKADELEALCQAVADAGGRATPLAVSGGFHSPLMQPAAEGFLQELSRASWSEPSIPVYANRTAMPYLGEIAPTLAAQMESPVLWKQTIEQMLQDGYTTFVEVGPGKTLTGLNKRIVKEGTYLFVQDQKSLEDALAQLG